MTSRLIVVVLAGWACLAGVARAEVLKLGAAAPLTTVKMKSVDGREVSIADVAGPKGTLVIFSCNACPFVKAWEDRVAALGNTYAKRGVGVIQINSNDPAQVAEDGYAVMQERAKTKGFAFPYVVDATSEVAAAYGASRTPEAFLFDKDGRLVYHGTVDDNFRDASKVQDHYLHDALEALIAGNEIAVKETKAVGCSIKFRHRS